MRASGGVCDARVGGGALSEELTFVNSFLRFKLAVNLLCYCTIYPWIR